MRLINYLISFFKSLWEFIKRFFTSWKGVVSFIISFMFWVGWAIVFVILGIIIGNAWLYSTGTAVILFWAGPFTPMWLLIITTSMVLQRYILRDKKAMHWKDIKAYYKSELAKEKEKSRIAREKRKIKRELRAIKRAERKKAKALRKQAKQDEKQLKKSNNKEVLPNYE